MSDKKTFGLIGYPLSHSFSQKYFSDKFHRENISDAEYRLFPMENLIRFREWINEHTTISGLNVTIPHKQEIIPFLDQQDAISAKVGAVNTIKIDRSGEGIILKGYNTDVYGFEKSLQPLLQNEHKSALVLGSGGASRAVIHVLDKLNIDHTIVSRFSGGNQLDYSQLGEETLLKNQIIINTTPLGMYPNIYDFPALPYQFLSSKHLVVDLIYNPEKTVLLKKAEVMGATTMNGMEMLRLQADKSWEVWNS